MLRPQGSRRPETALEAACKPEDGILRLRQRVDDQAKLICAHLAAAREQSEGPVDAHTPDRIECVGLEFVPWNSFTLEFEAEPSLDRSAGTIAVTRQGRDVVTESLGFRGDNSAHLIL